eukprot:4364100-Prymnesium_polylepis.1
MNAGIVGRPIAGTIPHPAPAAAGDGVPMDNMMGVPTVPEDGVPMATSQTGAPGAPQPPVAMYQIAATNMPGQPGPFPTEHAVLVPYATSVGDVGDDASRSMRKHAWTTQEDETLMRMVQTHGPGRWSQVASHLPGRMGKQCRERWFNHLAPDVSRTETTAFKLAC